MKNSLLQKVVAIIALICVVMGVLPAGSASADDNKPGTPTISVKLVNGIDAEITIEKTPGVDFYEVWVTSDCGYMGYKLENSFHPYYYNDDNPGNYINAAKVEKDGTDVRSVTVKNLTKGEVFVKVRGVKINKDAKYLGEDMTEDWYYGDFSEPKTVTVESSKTGYMTSYNFSKTKKGDIIKFGSYEQDYPVNGKDPIEWIVLDKKKDGLLVMSKYALDVLPYNTKCVATSWAECTLREWLNKKFYEAAFNSVEKEMIKTVEHGTYNYWYDDEREKVTRDKVFLLSLGDMMNTEYGFDFDIDAYDINRRCASTDYAVAQGGSVGRGFLSYYRTDENLVSDTWWLRGPGDDNCYAACVGYDGRVKYWGEYVDVNDDCWSYAVRPVMFISLASEDDNKPGTPTIKVKMVNDTDVKVTIAKTRNVDFYEVWVTSDCGYMGYKNHNYNHLYYYDDYNPGNYINASKVEKDGTAVRTVTVKNLTKGEVSVKVRGVKYKYNKKGSLDDSHDWYYGEFSEAKTVTVESSKTGYKTSYNFSKAKKGDIIKFGSYEQDYPVNGKDPIEWVVLDKKKDGLLVMSKYALDCLPYSTEDKDTTWAECTLREWLNKKFYNAAFNSVEKKMIKTAAVKNDDNPHYETEGGKDTKDKGFLLSLSEIVNTKYGFSDSTWDINRRCAPTDYAVAQGAYQYSGTDTHSYTADKIGACWWWLRSPGYYSNYAAYVDCIGSVSNREVNGGGYVSSNGDYVRRNYNAVRPVMFINLES